jgi:hypothetical protein
VLARKLPRLFCVAFRTATIWVVIPFKLKQRNGRPGIVPPASLDQADAPMADPRTLRALLAPGTGARGPRRPPTAASHERMSIDRLACAYSKLQEGEKA